MTSGSRCWWCGQALAPNPKGGLHFEEVRVLSGMMVRVHKGCALTVRNDQRKLTAQPPEPPTIYFDDLSPRLSDE